MYPGHWAVEAPERPAVVMSDSGEMLTYGELDARSNQLVRLLRSQGLKQGDHIAILMENQPRFFEVLWAALRSGLYVTPVNAHLQAEEVGYIIDDCEAKAVISSGALTDILTAVDWRNLPNVDTRLATGSPVTGFESYEAGLAEFESTPLDEESAGATLLYTSGTTGRPKGVLRPRPQSKPGDLDPVMTRFGAAFNIDGDSVYLSPAPLYHSAPILWTTSIQRLGGTVVVMPKFEAASALNAIERHRVTHSQWVPTMFVRMLALPAETKAVTDLSSHLLAIHAAAPCPAEVKRKMIDWWGPILLEYYAGTDSSGMTVINSTDWLEHPGSVGRSPNGAVRVMGDDGRELPPGTEGLVYFSGGPEFKYKGDPHKTAAGRLTGGLTTMGDVGYVDADGWLYLTDRKDFMIISGGVNVYPREAEDVLITHPAVLDVAVFGIPHTDLGEEAMGAVQLTAGHRPSSALAAELLEYCSARIARYKVPRSLDFVTELPRTPTGKLLKRTLRDQYIARTQQPG
jgi:long-chain acyl-CoA synthetase